LNRTFSTAALDLVRDVFREGKSAVLFRNGIRSRTVPAITVSLKMIIGLRGIITVELS
jgi:hypothetical protein